MTISTQKRIDEILAGCTLALARNSRWRIFETDRLGAASLLPPIPLPTLNYLRLYIAATLVGSTLRLGEANAIRRFLSLKSLKYVAQISFALYGVHACLVESCLGTGDKSIKYLNRPLFLAVTWALAHISSRYYEAYFTGLGKRRPRRAPSKE